MLLPFSDTTVKNGLIQGCERWTGLGDATISGDATQLKYFTAEINESFDELMPHIYRMLRNLGFDDSNQTGIPIKKSNISTASNLTSFTTDDNSVNITSITNVAILPTSTATEYVEIPQITADDPRAPFYISPNSLTVGVPSSCLVMGLKVYFDVIPNYNATNGIKVFVNREQYQFLSTDTTKKAALPSPFHSLLVYLPSLRWLLRNKPTSPAIGELQALIKTQKQQLIDFIGTMDTVHKVGTMGMISHR